MGRHERMKRGSGMEDREDRSKGIEIRVTDTFVIIKPTGPFKINETGRSKEMKLVRFL